MLPQGASSSSDWKRGDWRQCHGFLKTLDSPLEATGSDPKCKFWRRKTLHSEIIDFVVFKKFRLFHQVLLSPTKAAWSNALVGGWERAASHGRAVSALGAAERGVAGSSTFQASTRVRSRGSSTLILPRASGARRSATNLGRTDKYMREHQHGCAGSTGTTLEMVLWPPTPTPQFCFHSPTSIPTIQSRSMTLSMG